MGLSRRFFLKQGGMLGVAALIPGALSTITFGQSEGGASFKALSKNLAHLKMIDFHEQVTTDFRFAVKGLDGASSKWMKVQLVAVDDLRESPDPRDDEKGIEHFALQFRGPGNLALSQGTYSVKHDTLGKFKLFIVPSGEGSSSLNYMAIFNRLVTLD